MREAVLKKPPVLLVPGIAFDYAMLFWKFILEFNGFSVEIVELYRLFATKTIDEQARILSAAVDKALKKYRAQKCCLVGFSLGTAVSLRYIQKMAGNKKVAKCVNVVPPFGGTRRYLVLTAPAGIFIKSLWDIFPGSRFLEEIRFGNTGETEISVVCGREDLLCSRMADLSFAKNIISVDGGHIAIYCGLNQDAIAAVISLLSSKK